MAAAGADIRPLRGRCDRDADLASRIALVSALVQTLVPDWARARVLAVFILTCQGGLAAGSATWGVVATRIGIPATLVIAGLSTLDDCHVRLQEIAGRDRRHHAMEPLAAAAIMGSRIGSTRSHSRRRMISVAILISSWSAHGTPRRNGEFRWR